MATGGLVTGIIATLLGLIIHALIVIGFALLGNNAPDIQREIERQQRQLEQQR